MEKWYAIHLEDTIATGKVRLQSVATNENIYIPAISWSWVNDFTIKCKFVFCGEEVTVIGKTTPLDDI